MYVEDYGCWIRLGTGAVISLAEVLTDNITTISETRSQLTIIHNGKIIGRALREYRYGIPPSTIKEETTHTKLNYVLYKYKPNIVSGIVSPETKVRQVVATLLLQDSELNNKQIEKYAIPINWTSPWI